MMVMMITENRRKPIRENNKIQFKEWDSIARCGRRDPRMRKHLADKKGSICKLWHETYSQYSWRTLSYTIYEIFPIVDEINALIINFVAHILACLEFHLSGKSLCSVTLCFSYFTMSVPEESSFSQHIKKVFCI